jgi:16S rRNA (guanine966-N2)-methyltransferase
MRIISGKFKGRQLASFKADHIRPTMDRIKETLFNKLRHYTEGVRVLDLFAGTGNLGLEALSRGALHVTFVEVHPKSLQIIVQNCELLKIDDSEFDIVKKDVLKYLLSESKHQFDLIFIDPPFTEKMADEVMSALSQSKVFHDDTIIAIEAIKQEKIDDTYGELVCFDRQNYGDKTLSLFKKKDSIIS